MLERSVSDRNGTYLFCDTDSMCIVATEFGGMVDCEAAQGAHQIKLALLEGSRGHTSPVQAA